MSHWIFICGAHEPKRGCRTFRGYCPLIPSLLRFPPTQAYTCDRGWALSVFLFVVWWSTHTNVYTPMHACLGRSKMYAAQRTLHTLYAEGARPPARSLASQSGEHTPVVVLSISQVHFPFCTSGTLTFAHPVFSTATAPGLFMSCGGVPSSVLTDMRSVALLARSCITMRHACLRHRLTTHTHRRIHPHAGIEHTYP